MENILNVSVSLRLPYKKVKAGIYSVHFRKAAKKEILMQLNHRQVSRIRSRPCVWKGEQL